MSAEPQTPSLHLQQEIFFAALERSDLAAQKAYLDLACSGNLQLRERVEKLLWEAQHLEGFIEQPARLRPPGIFVRSR